MKLSMKKKKYITPDMTFDAMDPEEMMTGSRLSNETDNPEVNVTTDETIDGGFGSRWNDLWDEE